MSAIAVEKVVAYITWNDQLLVFNHPLHSEAGIQVPAGTCQPGETPEAAVLREAHEETGLEGLQIVSFLDSRDSYVASPEGTASQRRHFFHLRFDGRAPARWRHFELDPSDGSPAPIEFELYWVRFPDDVPELMGNQGELLGHLAPDYHPPFPGTSQHQAVLRAIVDHYRDDPRVLAIAVFGSLGRGNWDRHSDLDLDFVIADNVQVQIEAELAELGLALQKSGERAVLFVPEGHEEGDIVCESLLMLSARYHTLATTSPNIVDSMLLLAGTLSPSIIKAAGLANRQQEGPSLEWLLDAALRYAVVADAFLQRGQAWSAIEVHHRLRGLIMEMFVRARGGQAGGQAYKVFQAQADAALHDRLSATLPGPDLAHLFRSQLGLLDILERDLTHLSAGQIQLSDPQRRMVEALRAGP